LPFGPIGKNSFCFANCSRYFLGPKAALCASLGDLITNDTIVPAFTLSSPGKKSKIVVSPPTPATRCRTTRGSGRRMR